MDSRIPRPRNIVIIGGGVIGTTTAYFLTRHPSFNPAIHHITLLEATSIAAGASGKAGGLIGLWAYPTCLVPLSYRLHTELAAEHGGADRWGFRRVECGQLTATVKNKDLKKEKKKKKKKNSVNGSTPGKVKRERRESSNGGSAKTSANTTPSRQQNGQQQPLPSLPPDSQAPHHQQLPPSLLQPQIPNGDIHPQPTPQRNGQEQSNQGQEWQKLPKQNQEASALLRKSVLPADLDWIDAALVREYAEMGLPGYTETAQVHPYQFTTAMAELARSGGADIRTNAKATKIGLNAPETAVTSIEYLDRTTDETHRILGVTDVVVAAGPWTGRVLPRSRVEGLRAHSVVFEADVSPYAVFTDIALPADWAPAHRAARGERRKHRRNVDPEFYARPGGEVYACGEPDSLVPLPETADRVETDEAQCDDLAAYIGTVSPVLAAAPLAARQACYLPRHMRQGQESAPLVGATSVAGLWVAAGHTCWGIQNGPATGKLMSEFVFEGRAVSADVADLDPGKWKV